MVGDSHIHTFDLKTQDINVYKTSGINYVGLNVIFGQQDSESESEDEDDMFYRNL